MKRALAVFIAAVLIASLLALSATVAAKDPPLLSEVNACGDDDGWLNARPGGSGAVGEVGVQGGVKTSTEAPDRGEDNRSIDVPACESIDVAKHDVRLVLRMLFVMFFWPAR